MSQDTSSELVSSTANYGWSRVEGHWEDHEGKKEVHNEHRARGLESTSRVIISSAVITYSLDNHHNAVSPTECHQSHSWDTHLPKGQYTATGYS
jgi:hypothetical protein